MNTKLTSVLLVLILIVGIVGLIGIFQEKTLPFGLAGYNDLGYSGVTNSTTTISASVDSDGSDNILFPANSGRLYARMEPYDGTIFIQLDSATSTLAVGRGIQLDAGEIYEIGPDNLYIGRIMAIASSSTTTIMRIEK